MRNTFGLCVLVALSLGVVPSRADAQSAERLTVILDTDIGGDIDDAWALGFAMQSPDIDLVGVTITDQNTPARARVACKLLHVGGRDDVPVAVGRKTSDAREFQFTWAEDFTAKTPVPQPAADFNVDTVRKHPGAITLVAVGPLQNVADALRKEPNLGKMLKRVVLMSGSIGPSAWSSSAMPEWNVKEAAADAKVVYSARLPMTTVPLDSTTYVTLKEEERTALRTRDSAVTRALLVAPPYVRWKEEERRALRPRDPAVPRALESLYRLWIESPSSRMTLHDQLAVAETVRPGLFFARKDTLPIVVDDQGYTRV